MRRAAGLSVRGTKLMHVMAGDRTRTVRVAPAFSGVSVDPPAVCTTSIRLIASNASNSASEPPPDQRAAGPLRST